jgi:hypothetical protein
MRFSKAQENSPPPPSVDQPWQIATTRVRSRASAARRSRANTRTAATCPTFEGNVDRLRPALLAGAPFQDGVAPGEHRGVQIVEAHGVGVEALVEMCRQLP